MSTDVTAPATAVASRSAVWRHILAGLCASLVSIGLARFSYTPLIPPLIQAHWFSASYIVYLGAANLAGYLLGALLGRPIARKLSNVATLRLMMVLVTLSFLACAMPLSVAWFFGWRLVSGIAGGAIMVLVAATILPHVPPERRGSASGAIFLGLGLGIAGSGTLVPLLLNLGLWQTWFGLGVVSAVLTAASWFAWPPANAPAAGPVTAPVTTHAESAASAAPPSSSGVGLLYAQYALMAVGLVPAMVFFVDFIARGLGAGAHQGSLFWILYGVGAIFGPPVYGLLADRIGARLTMRYVLLVQLLAVAGLCSTDNHLYLALLTLLVGAFPPGIVPLMLARVRETVTGHAHAERQNVVWGRATTIFAAFQAVAGYSYSAIFNASGGSHRLLFMIGGIAIAIALTSDLGLPLLQRRRT
ncbi:MULTISPECIES: YbfB/YjiJ family MFS transporter [unclassified Herbaspirillum]|uniref:YbfB/YjiJ family MFS transporter n=1 Tax=unclassified Herbaspirillum TaxID=2624150 RepID=UPI000E2E9AB6|nr:MULTISPECIES: YbfB/YjiJ family MFS transporter [unclassified Herbaspirillum]RFB72878.1 YbfB/YjiJ family MFS transporter [Herbaspirillum sp. 3R-3a1]TFI11315.1 YbfB/YjiJ family MFS transporter [Herbaspirillum sp. 3R11]TFI17223.1 YbfB/YjiJ family MFS transporter [Herbaspirillum sp. 3R-11]TFI25449.1 YbfB/YjiJ family MFS transporter [Herbaspirillum sp. 3C11]